jgi:hypothetical protein
MESHIVFFVMACGDKITCEEIFYTIFHDVHMFIDYICTRYVYARIHQGINPNLVEAHQGLNHQTSRL